MAVKAGRIKILEEAEVPLASLKPDPDNANIHDQANLDGIKASLEAHGQLIRLVVRKRDGIVYDGSGRWEAMGQLAWTTARVQYVAGSDEACRAYAIAANKTARTSRFDDNVLAEQLEVLQGAGLLEAAAYTQEEYHAILEDLDGPSEFPSLGPGLPVTASEDANKTKCPKCGWAFRPGEKGNSSVARKEREAARKTKGKK